MTAQPPGAAGDAVLAALAGHLGRDAQQEVLGLEVIVGTARAGGADLLELQDATVGGCVDDLSDPPGRRGPPPEVGSDGPDVTRVAALPGGMVVCFGTTEAADGQGAWAAARPDTAACVHDRVLLGAHRTVHRPLGGSRASTPRSARNPALDGAEVLACPSAWPARATNRSASCAVVAPTWTPGGPVCAPARTAGDLARARRSAHHLRDRAVSAHGGRGAP